MDLRNHMHVTALLGPRRRLDMLPRATRLP